MEEPRAAQQTKSAKRSIATLEQLGRTYHRHYAGMVLKAHRWPQWRSTICTDFLPDMALLIAIPLKTA
jgi:hypothetical protein